MINSRLQNKLDRIRAGQYSATDFIIADAKDGDVALGISAPGPVRDAGPAQQAGREFETRERYLANMTAMAESGLIDILLMSASCGETLKAESLFERTDVTPAIRFNDTTDIWSARGSSYREHPSQPFATVDLETASSLCPFGLYSITFSNDVDADLKTLQAYRDFRLAARKHGVRHFLEVFNPAFDIGLKGADIGDYVNDMILKALTGVVSADAPLFLKMQFNGHKATADLAGYDPQNLVVGVLGGSAGTTRDTFELASQAEAAGARVALFGRKINLSESPVKLVGLMRQVIEKSLTTEQAVNAFHEHLQEQGIEPQRPLADDLKITDPVLMT